METIQNWYQHHCEHVSFNRIGLIAVVLIVQTCLLIPATLLAISLNGGSTLAFALMALFSFSTLVSLLGDMPTKIIIPLFASSVLVHLLIIVCSVI